uniref:Uncharacterized protein n=1 Tax=Arundo donax TaxID=35708 RepID=A0A0A9CJ22_ARUDO
MQTARERERAARRTDK